MNEHGGRREGAGRPKNARNNATLARAAVMSDALKRLGNQVSSMTALDAVIAILREAITAGQVELALTAAQIALPYTAARLAPVAGPDPNAPEASEIADDTDPDVMSEDRYGDPQ